MKASVKKRLQLAAISGMIALVIIFSQPSWGNSRRGTRLAPIDMQNTHTPLLAQNSSKKTIYNGTIDSNSPKLENGKSYNTYTLEGKAGEQITIEVNSTFDPDLALLDANGYIVALDQNNENDKKAKVTTTLPATETYTIVILTATIGQTGDYTLSIF